MWFNYAWADTTHREIRLTLLPTIGLYYLALYSGRIFAYIPEIYIENPALRYAHSTIAFLKIRWI